MQSTRMHVTRNRWASRMVWTIAILLGGTLPAGYAGDGAPIPESRVRAPVGLMHFEPASAASTSGYVARGLGYEVGIAPEGAAVRLGKRGEDTTLGIRLVGARADAGLVAEKPLPGRSHYLIGRDAASWTRDVPHAGRVRAVAPWPGIDVVWYGRDGSLEYDVVVAPGADPSLPRTRLEGADRLRIAPDGALEIHVGKLSLRQPRPFAYQDVGGRRVPVAADYQLLEGNEVAFSVGAYDRRLPLVIDPVLVYSTYFGGFTTGSQSNEDVVVDGDGNVYVAGYTSAPTFPTTFGAYRTTNPNATGQYFNAFVAKFSSIGELVWSTYIGGDKADLGYALARDASGALYVAGQTDSTDFPTTAGAYQTSLSAAQNAFVAKISADGASLLYGTYFPAGAANGIGVDSDGSIVFGGWTAPAANTPAVNAYQSTFGGGTYDGFLARLAPGGGSLTFSTFFGGSAGDELLTGLALDPSGNAYVTGWTTSTDFPTRNAFQATRGGTTPVTDVQSRDAFAAKFGPSGSLVYSTYLGGERLDNAFDLTVDADGVAYVVGETRSKGFPVKNTLLAPPREKTPGPDGFLTVLSANGSSLVFSTYLGGRRGTERATGVALSSQGIHVVGHTSSSDFPKVSAIQSKFAGYFDAFAMTFAANGSSIRFSSCLGGADYEDNVAVAASSAGRMHVVGRTHSTNFPTTAFAVQTSMGGAYEMGFLSYIDP